MTHCNVVSQPRSIHPSLPSLRVRTLKNSVIGIPRSDMPSKVIIWILRSSSVDCNEISTSPNNTGSELLCLSGAEDPLLNRSVIYTSMIVKYPLPLWIFDKTGAHHGYIQCFCKSFHNKRISKQARFWKVGFDSKALPTDIVV